MIHFFRKIRKKMADENKPLKYMRYAVGEIVLVVIGILIALQVNNWNEERKERKLEKKLLTEVYKSIASDTTNLNREMEDYEILMHHANFIKEKFKENGPYDQKLDTSFAIISNGFVRKADHTSFDRILDIGVDIIRNDSLRKQLVVYYDHSTFLRYVEDYYENSKYFRQHIYPKYFRSYKHSREVIPVDYEALKTSTEFMVALDYCINDANYYGYWSRHRKQEALDLLGMLREELHLEE